MSDLLTGRLRTLHRVSLGTAHEMTYGVIEAEGGAFYVYTSLDLTDDGSRILANAPCTFALLGAGHATNVSTVRRL